jgi:hypothetical protein
MPPRITRFASALLFVLLLPVLVTAQAKPGPATDPLGRLNPRSSVTAFLEACRTNDYQRAAQYLDLDRIPEKSRARQGPELARQLEQILNSDSHFDALRLTQNPQGNAPEITGPAIEHIDNIEKNGHTFSLDLQRVQLNRGPQAWLFSAPTVAVIPELTPGTTESAITAQLPRFLITLTPLDTPLWKWIALLCLALLVALGFRFVARLVDALIRAIESRSKRRGAMAWLLTVVEPGLVLLAVMLFRIIEGLVDPSVLARLYIA